MSKNWYLRKDAEFVVASANYSSLISAAPTDYGLEIAQATAFATLNTVLQSTYTAAITPETRTPVAIEAKNTARQNVKNQAVLLSKIIYATPTVSDAQLVALGLLPRPVYTPRPSVTTPPVLEVLSVSGRLVNVRIHALTSEGARKPIGSVGAQVYSFVGTEAPTDPRQYHYEGLATRGKCDVLFPNTVTSGATAWIAAAWVSQRGIPGIACTPVQVTIQGGPVLAEAA